VNKWRNEPNKFFKGIRENGQKIHEEMLNIPDHKGNANQTTLRFHLTPVRIGIIKNTTTSVGKVVGIKEPSYTVGM
jgi:hypothetical protein